MTRPSVILDLDDTLIHTGRNYEVAKENFYRFMGRFGMGRSLCIQRFDETQIMNQYSSEVSMKQKFPIAMYMIYKSWCTSHRVTFSAALAEEAYELGYAVYGMEYPAMEGSHELLGELGRTHDLYLYTVGDTDFQIKKVLDAGLDEYFKGVGLPDRKTASTLTRFMLANDMPADSTWVIGNSAAWDILPALEVGIPAHQCVWMDTYAWAIDHAEIPEGVHRVKELGQITAIFKQLVVPV